MLDSYREQPISSIFEELDTNHEDIFIALVESANFYLKSLIKERDKIDEEAAPWIELLQKTLYSAEIFLSTESKLSVTRVMDLNPNIPRLVNFRLKLLIF